MDKTHEIALAENEQVEQFMDKLHIKEGIAADVAKDRTRKGFDIEFTQQRVIDAMTSLGSEVLIELLENNLKGKIILKEIRDSGYSMKIHEGENTHQRLIEDLVLLAEKLSILNGSGLENLINILMRELNKRKDNELNKGLSFVAELLSMVTDSQEKSNKEVFRAHIDHMLVRQEFRNLLPNDAPARFISILLNDSFALSYSEDGVSKVVKELADASEDRIDRIFNSSWRTFLGLLKRNDLFPVTWDGDVVLQEVKVVAKKLFLAKLNYAREALSAPVGQVRGVTEDDRL